MADSAGILSLVVAWLFGLLSPGIVRSIERRYQAKEIRSGILAELGRLRHTIALVAFRLRARAGTLDSEFLTWFGSVFENDDKSDDDGEWREAYRRLLQLPPAQLNNSPLGKSLAGQAPRPVPYTLPYLDSQLGNLSLFPIDLQRRLMEVRYYLQLFNNDVDFVRSMLALTFDPSSLQQNQAAIDTNIEKGYQALARRSEGLARDIDQVRGKYA